MATNGRRPLILFHNDFFGSRPWETPSLGDIGCDITSDRALAPEADAVVLHIPGLKRGRLNVAKHPRNLWVLWSMESVVNYPVMADRRALRHFDLRMTYEQDADVWVPYLPHRAMIEKVCAMPLPAEREAAPLVLFQSARIDRCGRYQFAAELMRHVRTDSYGRIFNNRTLGGPDLGEATKRTLLSRYKFTLAIENSIAPDYVTEKFFDPLLVGSVPVYRGAPNVRDFAPGPKSYIDANDFGSPKELARYLLDLAADEAGYAAYFAWRKGPEKAFLDKVAAREDASFVRLGRAVRERLERRGATRMRTIYPFSPARRLVRRLARSASKRLSRA